MNDLEELRAFRDEVRAPGRDRLAPGRERLLRSAAGRRRTPVRRMPVRRLAVAGTAVAALGAGVVIVVPDGGGPPPVAARPVSATVFLERAAQIVETRPDHRPGDHQWVYTKVFHGRADPRAPEHEVHQESWTRFDGLKTARYSNGKELKVEDEDWVKTNEDSEERTPAQWYDHLRALPGDPSALVTRMRARAREYDAEMRGEGYGQGLDQWVFRRLAGFLANEPSIPRSGRAAVYRAIGRLPGVQVRQGAKDALGRRGVAVTRTADDGIRDEVVLTAGSYRYLGMRVIAARELTSPAVRRPVIDQTREASGVITAGELPFPRRPVPAGTVMIDQALEASGVVGRPGQRP
ncbi:CU044_5270 family protein [Actinomadura sp. 3N407]|uniref:CU044_5270 family protein n=1 Tax=Actinomadura sp. 3N407 TaxID=3457423 RepID=UPI003FCD0AB3